MPYEPRNKWLGKGGRIRRRGIYWLPNLFTTVALFAGFFSIVQAMNGRFEQSALAIFVAMVFDGLDGRVARFTHTQSAFGAEYDSLSDMVSFGVAPALVIYEWALKDFSSAQNIPMLGAWVTTKLGWIAAFIYCACAALRLARFNTQLEVADKRYFQGLPSPAAACVVAGLVWALNEHQIGGADVKWLAWVLTMFAGLTMVSNFKYLQRQGHQSAQKRVVPRGGGDRAGRGRAGRGFEHAARNDVHPVRMLCALGLCAGRARLCAP